MLVINLIMKKTLLFQLLIFSTLIINAQNTLISKDEITINGIKMFDLTFDALIENFGEPQSIEDFFFEMSNKSGKKIIFDGLLIYLIDGKVKSFEITLPRYALTTHEIRVFQRINNFEDYFSRELCS